jgi:hypothetical protein
VSTSHNDKAREYTQTYYYRWRRIRNVEGPLWPLDGNMRRGVEQHRDTMKDFVPLYLLRHLSSTVSLPLEFISEVEPLFCKVESVKK